MSGEQRPLVGRRARPVVAAILALAIAGLGHAYLRRWGRAAGWFAMILGTGLALVGTFADPGATVDQLPQTVILPIVVLFLLSAADAYLLARDATPADGDAGGVDAEDTPATTCPHCGKEVDESLEFCHWCTEPLAAAEDVADD